MDEEELPRTDVKTAPDTPTVENLCYFRLRPERPRPVLRRVTTADLAVVAAVAQRYGDTDD